MGTKNKLDDLGLALFARLESLQNPDDDANFDLASQLELAKAECNIASKIIDFKRLQLDAAKMMVELAGEDKTHLKAISE